MALSIEHCRLIDGTGANPVGDGWVFIRDGMIEEIGSHDKSGAPRAGDVIDAGGRTLLPGLFNLHVHIQRRHLSCAGPRSTFKEGAPAVENARDTQRMVYAVKNAWREMLGGVTTIRDCASKNRVNIDLRNMIREGIVHGPTVLACGFGIAATGGHETHHYQGAVEADGPDEIRKAVRTEIKAGADFIKFMGSGGIGGMPEHEDPGWVELDTDELAAGIREAHHRGRKTTVHAMGAQAVITALEAGIDCIEHGAKLDEKALALMEGKGVYYVPTLSGVSAVCFREHNRGNEKLARLIEERVIIPQMDSVHRAYDRGIVIGCGTDTLGSVVEELMLLKRCDLTAMECIKAATANAAHICGLQQTHGTLEVGKTADMLLIDGDPLSDLKMLGNIFRVYKSGDIVDSSWFLNL